jgi:hypothetical protein
MHWRVIAVKPGTAYVVHSGGIVIKMGVYISFVHFGTAAT